MFLEVIGKAFDNAGILAWRDEDHAPAVHVGDQRDIVVATSARGFVNGHRGDFAQVSRGHR